MQEKIILSSISKEQLAEEIADKVINRIGAAKPQRRKAGILEPCRSCRNTPH